MPGSVTKCRGLTGSSSNSSRNCPRLRAHPRLRTSLLVIGASLCYGDTVLTPAICVLSAVEGLEVGTAAFSPSVVPIAIRRGGALRPKCEAAYHPRAMRAYAE